MTTSAPKPPVSSRIASTGSRLAGVDGVGGADASRRSSSLRSSMSTAMIFAAPASRAPAIAASPTPPQPMTATVSPAADVAGVDRRADAGHHTAAQQPGDRRRRPPGRPWCTARRRPASSRRRRRCPGPGTARCRRGEGHLLLGVVGVEAVPGAPAQTGAALPAHRTPVEDHEVAGRDVGDALADRLHDARGLVAEQEREVVVDPALLVVQVGVADPAGLDLHHRLAGPGVGHDDRLDPHRLVLARCDHAAYFLRHGAAPWSAGVRHSDPTRE